MASQNKNRTLIFFDIDGTLADFVGHAQRQGKMTPAGAFKYDEMDTHWWATMPAYAGARALFDAACKLGDTKFLTGPALNPACFEGKAQWVQDFVPEKGRKILEDLIICRSVDKQFLSAKGRILIDDRPDNINAWNKAGGIGILYTGNSAETLKKIQEAVARLEAPRYKKILRAIFKPKASKTESRAPAAKPAVPKLV